MSGSIRLDIRANVAAYARYLYDFSKKQLPFATAQGINDIAFQVMRAENAAMSKVFKNPRVFTKTATQVERKAIKSRPSAIVSIRPDRPYLSPYETGGLHLLPGKALLNPKAISLDAYGQIPKDMLKRLLARKDVFVATIRGVTGFWQRLPKGNKLSDRVAAQGYIQVRVRLLIRFGRALPVNKHLNFKKRAIDVVNGGIDLALGRALLKAIATAKA